MTAWESAGLKASYETGELIVLRAPATAAAAAAPKTALYFEGPEGNAERRVRVEARSAPDGAPYFEFYALNAGRYRVSAPWGRTNFDVRERRALDFQIEFGLFAAVVVVLVVAMARRFKVGVG
jgi:hypothetical protein